MAKIFEILKNGSRFGHLVDIIQTPGVEEMLQADGPMMFFAPVDDPR